MRLLLAFLLVLLVSGAEAQIKSPYPSAISRSPIAYNTVDATQSSGADMCAKISAAANTLSGANSVGGTVDARGFSGTQNCAGSMFASWPSGAYVVLIGGVTIVTDVPIVVPSNTSLLGVPNLASGVASSVIQASNNFLLGASSTVGAPTAPTLAGASGGGGSLSGTVYVRISYGNAGGGESYASCLTGGSAHSPVCTTTSSIVMGANVRITFNSPAAATGATVYYVYAGTSDCSGALATPVTNCTLTNPGGTAIGTATNLLSIPGNNQSPALAIPLVTLGSATTNTANNYYGSIFENISPKCSQPNATVPQTLTGIYNFNAQQNSWFRNVTTVDCWIMGDLEVASNSGPYNNLAQGGGTSLGASSVCMYIGTHFASSTDLSISRITCGTNGSTPQTTSIFLDANGIHLDAVDLEFAVTGVEIGSSRGANVTVNNTYCAPTVTTCFDLSSFDLSGAKLTGIVGSAATNVIVDHNTGGQTIAAPAQVADYTVNYVSAIGSYKSWSSTAGFVGPLVAAGSFTNSGIASSAQADVVCTTSAGLFSYQVSATGCASSALRFKNPDGIVSGEDALDRVMKVRAAPAWRYKDAPEGSEAQIGLYADDVCAIDRRLCAYDKDGRIENYDKNGALAYLWAALQQQQKEIEALTHALQRQ